MGKRFKTALIVSAILVGLLHVAPQLLIKKNLEQLGRTFVAPQFVSLSDGGDSYFQFAREVYEGHFPPGDMFSPERLPNVYPWLPPVLLAFFIWIFRDVSIAYLGALFVYSAFIFIFFFVIGQFVFDKKRLWSLAFGFIGAFTPAALVTNQAFFSIGNFANIFLKNFYPAVNTPLPTLFFGRVDYPLLTHVVYLPAIIFLIMFWRNPSIRNAFLAGGFAGLLFYTYFHKWAYWVTVIGVLFLLTLVFFRSDKKRLRNFLLLIGIVSLVGIPYFINYSKFNALPGSSDFIQRLSLEIGRSFNLTAWPDYLLYVVLIVLVYLFFRMERQQLLLFGSFLIAAFIVWNVQFVTGFVPHSDHWPRAINPLLFLIIFTLLYKAVHWLALFRPRVKQAAALILVLAAMLLIVKKAVNAAAFLNPFPAILEQYTLPQDLLDSFAWFNQQGLEPRVASPSFVTSIYLTGFTSARPILPWGGVTPLSNSEIEKLFLRSNKLFGVSEATLEARLRDGKGLNCSFSCDMIYGQSNIYDSRFHIYQLYFMDPKDPSQRAIPEDKINELLDRYRVLKTDWRDIGADFVYLGPLEKQFTAIDFDGDRRLRLVYENALVKIYGVQ